MYLRKQLQKQNELDQRGLAKNNENMRSRSQLKDFLHEKSEQPLKQRTN